MSNDGKKYEVTGALQDGRQLIRISRANLLCDPNLEKAIRAVKWSEKKDDPRKLSFDADIAKAGILEPIHAFEENGEIKIFSGFHRFKASKAESFDVIFYPKIKRIDAIQLGMKLNSLRSQAHEADMIGLIEDGTLPVKTIADVCGVDPKTVERWTAVVKAGLYELVKTSYTNQARALELVKLLEKVPGPSALEIVRTKLLDAVKAQFNWAKAEHAKKALDAAAHNRKFDGKPMRFFGKQHSNWCEQLKAAVTANPEELEALKFGKGEGETYTKPLREIEDPKKEWKAGIPRLMAEGRKWSELDVDQLEEINSWAATLVKRTELHIKMKDVEEEVGTGTDNGAAETGTGAGTEGSELKDDVPGDPKPQKSPAVKKPKMGRDVGSVGEGENPGPTTI